IDQRGVVEQIGQPGIPRAVFFELQFLVDRPDAGVEDEQQQGASAAPAEGARYILQAGAFGAPGDAEEVKAKIAMLGLGARVESGQANGRTVYRVRMGPYASAGELAEAKQKLAASGLPAMAIRAQ
ncbi:MAG: SPOR domain-containing protein, partial [Xanthomonadales bacterium]|nr:SPOR domain-containing protein [Xanthomonadales bacterium]